MVSGYSASLPAAENLLLKVILVSDGSVESDERDKPATRSGSSCNNVLGCGLLYIEIRAQAQPDCPCHCQPDILMVRPPDLSVVMAVLAEAVCPEVGLAGLVPCGVLNERLRTNQGWPWLKRDFKRAMNVLVSRPKVQELRSNSLSHA